MLKKINKNKIVIVASTGITINAFFKNHINFLLKKYYVVVISNFQNLETLNLNHVSNRNLEIINLPISRGINLFSDFYCLISLFFYLIKIKPTLIFSCTPKAGLISSICSFILRIKSIHIFTGQVWVTKKGIQRLIIKNFDWLIAKLSNYLLADSASQKNFLISNKIAKKNKINVLGNGSISGVNTDLFIPDYNKRKIIRKNLGIANDTFLIIFIGRLNKDKGVIDLFHAFQKVLEKKIDCNLLIVGNDEEGIKKNIYNSSNYKDKIHFVNFTDKPEQYMAAADLFCLPSYREGFGMAAVEAGSCGLPVITSRIYGLTDAVEEGVTGLMHPPGDVEAISQLIIKIYSDRNMSLKMGEMGRSRAVNLYNYNEVSLQLFEHIRSISYTSVIKKRKIAIVASTSLSISCFLVNHVNNFTKKFDVTIITKIDPIHNLEKKLHKDCKFINLNFSRDINIPLDVIALFRLFIILLFNRYYCVLTFTPKGGLLGMITSFISGTKYRIHWFGGQVWANKSGSIKLILKFFDKLIYFLSTNALTECQSQKKFLEEQKIVKNDYLKVLGNGSICGVDNSRFRPNQDFRNKIRLNYNIPKNNFLILYLGRLNVDKGVYDLIKAADYILKNHNNINFMFVGPDEEGIKKNIYNSSNYKDKIHFVNFTDKPEQYMAAADLFCLPSYREGFGMAAVEAGSCGLPVITSRIYGLTDAVEEGVTGLMHPPGDVEELKKLIEYLIKNKKIMQTLGSKSIKRNNLKFSNHLIEKNFVNYLQETVK